MFASGAGFLAAAVVTPLATARLEPQTWVVVLLVLATVAGLFPAALYTEPAILVSAFGLGVVGQGVKICVDTIVQESVEDAYRGRVFSIYDVIFNVTFVVAAATAAAVLPQDGRSHLVLVVLSAGYLATAAGYWTATRGIRRLASPGSP